MPRRPVGAPSHDRQSYTRRALSVKRLFGGQTKKFDGNAAGIDHRLGLIGDAGGPDPDGELSLAALAHQAALVPERTTVVFLGDNVYPTGMPEEAFVDDTFVEEVEDVVDEVFLDLFARRKDAERRIDAQIDAVRGSGARAIFIPGNHDWDQFGVGGWERVQHLEAYMVSGTFLNS